MYQFDQVKALVVGDLMLDEYWQGQCQRVSCEAPIPIVDIESQRYVAGGASNVAMNMQALGAQVTLLGMIGQDVAGERLKSILNQKGVNHTLVELEDQPTILKLRVVAQHNQVLRTDFEQCFDDNGQDELMAAYLSALPHCDVVVLSDYAKGTLKHVERLIQHAIDGDKPIVVDPKGMDFKRYQGATVITPNTKEMQDVIGGWSDQISLHKQAKQLVKKHRFQAILLTQGANGMTLFQQQEKPRHIDAIARDVFDVTGAGDTVVATLALAIAAKMDFAVAMHLANTAASVAVSRFSTTAVSLNELNAALSSLQTTYEKQLDAKTLPTFLNDVRIKQQRLVVVISGFDLIVLKHIECLQQAKLLADQLLVLLIDDTGFEDKHLPVVAYPDRMKVVEALDAVDGVHAISKENGKDLLQAIEADIVIDSGEMGLAGIKSWTHAYGGQYRLMGKDMKDHVKEMVEKLRG